MTNTIILRDNEEKQWIKFQNPYRIFSTNNTNEVLPILKEIEALVLEKKYYAAGFISYEAAPAFDKALRTKDGDSFPLIWFGIFENFETFEFDKKASTFSFQNWESLVSKKEYLQKFTEITNSILRGDTYQVNFSFRQIHTFLEAENIQKENNFYAKSGFQLFQKIAPSAPFGAFLDLEDFTICSASPELFFKVKDGKIVSKPMKGTAPRGRTNKEDKKLKSQLFHSQKDRSENVMIVDMIRNDISKIAETGTVKTPRLFDIEKYPTLWQMTSRVEAKTQAFLSEIMKALFPCASITGAPKVSTMNIITELENSPRRIYTGTIGFLKPSGEMQFNVAIRTALIDKKRGDLEYGTGGGITIQSKAENEYFECRLKTKILQQTTENHDFKLLETMLWTAQEGWFLLDYHLKRIQESAAYFDYSINLENIKKALFQSIKSLTPNKQKVRLLLEKDGNFEIQNYPLISDTTTDLKSVAIHTKPIDSNDPFIFHKTTNRHIYEKALQLFPSYEDVILWNQQGEITESCYGNVVVLDKGRYYTPPLNCGLLNGTFRQFLIESGKIQERILLKEDLEKMEKIFLINSVWKWKEVQIKNLVQFKPKSSGSWAITE